MLFHRHNMIDNYISHFFAHTECGLQTVELDPENIIIGGGPAQSGEWPWQAALHVNAYYTCGGSLLAPEWIVTSADCM